MLNAVKASNSDFTLALGDLSYGVTGQEQQWCNFVVPKVGAGYPFELLSGNHESNGQNGSINDFAACLPNQLPGAIGTYGREYFVDVPAEDPIMRFIMISPGLTFPTTGIWTYADGTPNYNWTASAIDGARTKAIPWVVVGMHKPCLSMAQYGCDPGSDLFNLLVNRKVDLVVSGHEHTYQRTKQLAVGAAGCASITPGTYNASCVVDADDTMVAGAGSVAVVVGTGGQVLYDVNPADTEAAFFAKRSGMNDNPTWGALDVDATDQSLTASFLRGTGGTFADSFTLTKGAQPTNQPPVANFTASCTDLSCNFDGTGSSDPDGTIASYAWTFGDQSSGTGSTPNHSYAAAGSFSVTLTVTDDDGATAFVTKSVTPANPPVTSYAADAFSRTVANGWGSAPTGGAWTVTGTAANYAVADGVGTVRINAGSGPQASLNAVSAPSTDSLLTAGFDKVATGSGFYANLHGRRVNGQGAYLAKARVISTGSIGVALARTSGAGAETIMQSEVTVPGLTLAAGERFNIRMQVTGQNPTTVRTRVWKAGTIEPTTWQRSVTDSTAGLQAPGSVGIGSYISGGATNGPITLRVDELTVSAP